MRICIGFPRGKIFASLQDTPTAQALIDALPIESTASTWGEEVYFASREDECRLVTSVNILGEVEGDPRELEKIRDGDEVQVTAV
jgi:hypothetical protein